MSTANYLSTPPGPERRRALQALTLAEFAAEVTRLRGAFPRLFRDEQAAYHYLRLIVGPCVTDIDATPEHYVMRFGGIAVFVEERTAPGLTRLMAEMDDLFGYLYPPQFRDLPLTVWGTHAEEAVCAA